MARSMAFSVGGGKARRSRSLPQSSGRSIRARLTSPPSRCAAAAEAAATAAEPAVPPAEAPAAIASAIVTPARRVPAATAPRVARRDEESEHEGQKTDQDR